MWKLWRDFKDARRLGEIVSVFAEEGLGHLIDDAKLKIHIRPSTLIKIKLRNKKYETASDKDLAIRMRKAFERLGPTFVKLGQVLSVRPDLLPQEYIEEFEKLQESTLPLKFNVIEKQVSKELGRPIKKIFRTFDKKPIASASLSQAHKATLWNGDEVLVKVQRPNIEPLIKSDLRILAFIVHTLKDKYKYLDLPKVVNEFAHWTLKEIDFSTEAEFARHFADNFKDNKQIVIPKVYDKLSTQRIITFEFIRGISLNDFLEGKKAPFKVDKLKIARLGLDSFVKQVVIDGFFHADPHPGNILLLPGNRLAYVDFGMMGELDSSLRKDFMSLMLHLGNKDSSAAIDKLIEMSRFSKFVRLPQLKKELLDLFESWYGRQRSKFSVAHLLYREVLACSKHHLILPSKFTMLCRTLLVYDGVAHQLVPTIIIDEELAPIVEKYLAQRMNVLGIMKDLIKNKEKYLLMLTEIPEMFDTIKKIQHGEIEVHLAREDVDAMHRSISSQKNYKLFALLSIGATLAGSFLFVSTQENLLNLPMHYAFAGTAGLFLPFLFAFLYFIRH